MKIAGIVAEYNPFHNGHAHHIQQTRAQDGRCRVYSDKGAFLLLGEVRGGVLYTVKSFFEVEG